MVRRGPTPSAGYASAASSQVPLSASGSTMKPPNQEPTVGSLASLRGSFRRSGFSEAVTDFLLKAWNEKTLEAYGRHIKIWNKFCVQEKVDPFFPPVTKLLDHLFLLFHNGKANGSGYSYSSLNVARSAISAVAKINGVPAGQNEMLCLFMKSAAKQRSKFPKNNFTWDSDAFLHTFNVWRHNNQLCLSSLAKKVAGLLLILSGQRFQTIDCLDIRNMSLTMRSFLKLEIH
ncbi:hypothetical protein E2C01_068915 [Portunus trituberculatus]|uniref:Uncharacterized protein n=1 Tax=Portunus trituberculatus TaxID=210409 RepID=A0A5B7HT98_PORTR|nr:hypothetical protein [Portunus trituberculatus]